MLIDRVRHEPVVLELQLPGRDDRIAVGYETEIGARIGERAQTAVRIVLEWQCPDRPMLISDIRALSHRERHYAVCRVADHDVVQRAQMPKAAKILCREEE